jgi:hypothetical protein
MKIIALILITALYSICSLAHGQEKNGAGIGFNINQFQNDFGLGLHMTSPYFICKSVAVKIGGNLQWLQHTNNSNNEFTWTPYGNIQLGIRNRRIAIVQDKIFAYGEGGMVLLLPHPKFSAKKMEPGGYGLFGFDFSVTETMGYFIELGGIGTGARADKALHRPIFSNGFTTSAGFRIRL